ncbi:hypothetical protein SDC9_205911 [bioreactor metagenome]|uniref:Uncharacterized protein n=1 Tax=bioreactor metagenome TaxID=1076179 RepID=A0A645J3H6_9ZZZZ
MDEDKESINDAMFVVDVQGTAGLVDLPSRHHDYGYGINFADGHAQIYKFKDRGWAQAWKPGGVPNPKNGVDWQQVREVSTQLK